MKGYHLSIALGLVFVLLGAFEGSVRGAPAATSPDPQYVSALLQAITVSVVAEERNTGKALRCNGFTYTVHEGEAYVVMARHCLDVSFPPSVGQWETPAARRARISSSSAGWRAS